MSAAKDFGLEAEIEAVGSEMFSDALGQLCGNVGVYEHVTPAAKRVAEEWDRRHAWHAKHNALSKQEK